MGKVTVREKGSETAVVVLSQSPCVKHLSCAPTVRQLPH